MKIIALIKAGVNTFWNTSLAKQYKTIWTSAQQCSYLNKNGKAAINFPLMLARELVYISHQKKQAGRIVSPAGFELATKRL
jgi:hypothetical protein